MRQQSSNLIAARCFATLITARLDWSAHSEIDDSDKFRCELFVTCCTEPNLILVRTNNNREGGISSSSIYESYITWFWRTREFRGVMRIQLRSQHSSAPFEMRC